MGFLIGDKVLVTGAGLRRMQLPPEAAAEPIAITLNGNSGQNVSRPFHYLHVQQPMVVLEHIQGGFGMHNNVIPSAAA
jgi:hypothetical protein